MKGFVDFAGSFLRSKKERLVYYVPGEKAELDGAWFAYPKGAVADYYNLPMMRYCLEQSGFSFKVTDASEYELEADRVERVIVFNLPYYNGGKFLEKIPKAKKVIFIWEPPSVVPELYDPELHKQFDRVFTWQDDLVDKVKYFKIYYQFLGRLRSNPIPFEERRLCSMINRNKSSLHPSELYTERIRAIRFFESLGTKEFALYGEGWDSAEFSCFEGAPQDKLEALSNFRFHLCYENMKDIKGYVSEKILDAFASGCIPIYLGASNIEDFVPPDCFIDMRKFSSYEDLYSHIKKISQAEAAYYQRNISSFMNSPAVEKFTAKHFAETVMKDVMKMDISQTLKEAISPSSRTSVYQNAKACPLSSYSQESYWHSASQNPRNIWAL